MAEPKKSKLSAATESADNKTADAAKIDLVETPKKKTTTKKTTARKSTKKEAVKDDEKKAEKAPAKTTKRAAKKAAGKTAAKTTAKKAAAVDAAKPVSEPAAEKGKTAAPAAKAVPAVEVKAEENTLKALAEKQKPVITPVKEEVEAVVVEETPAPAAEVVVEAAPVEAVVEETVAAEAPKAEAKPAAKEEAPKAEAKPAAKKEAPKAEAKPAAKEEAPKAEAKPAAKKDAPKAEAKPAAEKEAPKAEVKEEAKPAVEKEVKAAVKEEPKKKAAKPAAKKAAKAEPAPVVEEKVVEEVKVPEVDVAEKIKHYHSFGLDTELAMANAMGIQKSYDDIMRALLLSDDVEQIAVDMITEAGIKAGDFNFEEDGYDITLIPVLVEKVADSMDFKASDYREIARTIASEMAYEYSDDPMRNAEEYHKLFDVVRKILMLAQQKGITSTEEMAKMIPADIRGIIIKFMDLAYPLLKNWQYNDVLYYEGFINAVLSQFDDLREELGNRAMMDVADLLIVHGDYGLGDANYNYVIRENKLKDYIFYRFANIYKDIDLNKAKSIANSALRFVDGRYTYYPEIIRILEMW